MLTQTLVQMLSPNFEDEAVGSSAVIPKPAAIPGAVLGVGLKTDQSENVLQIYRVKKDAGGPPALLVRATPHLHYRQLCNSKANRHFSIKASYRRGIDPPSGTSTQGETR